ncbi:MAG: EAL domain-containing protein [Bacilli bacterium]
MSQTNLLQLVDWNPDFVKLDRSFVARGDYALIRTLRRFFEDFPTKVVVEGVQTRDIARCVGDCGIRYIQGLGFGVPKSAEEFLRDRERKHKSANEMAFVSVDPARREERERNRDTGTG